MWDLTAGKEVLRIAGGWQSAAYSPDGQLLAAGAAGGVVGLWDSAGNALFQFKGHRGAVNGLAFSSDGRRLLTVAGSPVAQGEIRIWDTATGEQLLALSGHQGPILSVAVSRDDRWLLTGGQDVVARLWRLEVGPWPR